MKTKAIQQTEQTEQITPKINGEKRKPAARSTSDEAQARLFKFIETHGLVQTLDMFAAYSEAKRDDTPVSDQPLRAYWRKIQKCIKEAADRIDNYYA